MIKKSTVIVIIIISISIIYSLFFFDSENSADMIYSLSTNDSFTGQITGVYNNYTVQVNNNTIVNLALLETNVNESSIQIDATHFMSVLCPIRSPAIIYPDVNYQTNNGKQDFSNNDIDAIVYCQSAQNYNNETLISINEQLLKGNLAFIDEELCTISKFAKLSWATREGC